MGDSAAMATGHTSLAGEPAGQRFLRLSDVAEILNISAAQAYALVRNGALPAIKVGGRGQWRVERTELEAYIQRAYAETEEFLREHPFGATEQPTADDLR
jgi:excisionase family DNA binding protein